MGSKFQAVMCDIFIDLGCSISNQQWRLFRDDLV